MKNKVSVVIIGRNEEKSIGRCLEAVLSAVEQIGFAEVIYVDSASTDKTVEVVESYGVKTVSLSSEIRLSPSAGRYFGTQHATGDYILFVDSDTLVYRDFLPTAIDYFEKNPEVAGINGYLDDLNENGELLTSIEERSAGITDVKWLRGPACFYRRQALEQAGTFAVDLMVEEEAELGLRLLKNGWKLKILPISMACHTRCFHGQTFDNLISAFKRDIAVKRLGEVTVTAGRAFQGGFGLAFCWLRLKTTILFLAWLILLSVCIILPDFLHPFILCFSTVIIGGLIVFAKKRNFKQTILFFFSKFLNFVDLIAGLPKITRITSR